MLIVQIASGYLRLWTKYTPSDGMRCDSRWILVPVKDAHLATRFYTEGAALEAVREYHKLPARTPDPDSYRILQAPSAIECAMRQNALVFHEYETQTLRMCPQNYLLAVCVDGRWKATTDKAANLNDGKLQVLLDRHAHTDHDPRELANAVAKSLNSLTN